MKFTPLGYHYAACTRQKVPSLSGVRCAAVPQYGELIVDLLFICDDYAKTDQNIVKRLSGPKTKVIIELSTIENPSTDFFYSPIRLLNF